MIDNGVGFGAHAASYAIIGSLSQDATCDNRHCGSDDRMRYGHVDDQTSLRPEVATIFRRLEAADLSQRQLADAIGIEENKVSKVKAGTRQLKGVEILRAMEWLDQQEREKDIPSAALRLVEAGEAEIVQIDKLDLSLSMGPGTVIDDYVHAEPVSFDLAFIRAITRSPASRLKLVTGIGDSMYPTLNWGDAILVDTTDRQLAKQDGIYWIDLYGAAGLKRLRTIARDRVLVISDNPAVADQEVAKEDLRIEGRAIWVARGL